MAKNITTGAGTRRKTSAAARAPAEKKLELRNRRALQEMLRRLGPYPRGKVEDDPSLPRRCLDWRLKRARIMDAWNRNLVEINYPTEALTVDYSIGRQSVVRNPTRVRQSEAWRHNQLTSMQRQAETEMQIGWKVLTVGLSASISRYGAPRGAPVGAAQEHSAGVDDDYLKWSRNALAEKFPLAVFLDVLTEPRTLQEIERSRKLKPGKALAIYQRGLDLWCEMRGWARRKVEPVHEVPLTVEG
jgi:hypothetical protein